MGGTQVCGALLALSLFGCDGATGPSPSQPDPTELWIYATGLLMEPGDTIAFGVTAWDDGTQQLYTYPPGADSPWNSGYRIRWSSSDSSVAVVKLPGKLVAWGPGRAQIWVEVGERRDSATVLVGPVSGLEELRYAAVGAGGQMTCGLSVEGSVYCWGLDFGGVLGRGRVRMFTAAAAPDAVSGGHRFASVAVGYAHVCALTGGGEAFCWGLSTYGALGDGNDYSAPETAFPSGRGTPERVKTNIRFTALVAGYQSTCGLDPTGNAYCWGWNVGGQLGTGSFGAAARATEPSPVSQSPWFVSLAAGLTHVCGLTPGGMAYCWGSNHRGQLGNPSAADQCTSGACATTPVPVEGSIVFASLAAGALHTCGVTPAGAIYCWGLLDSIYRTPRPIAGAPPLRSLSAGAAHTCGLTELGEAYCWGENLYGQLGNGESNGWDYIALPQRVLTGTSFTMLSARSAHTCGVAADASVYCWGSNDHGQLGNGEVNPMYAPLISINPVPIRVIGVP